MSISLYAYDPDRCDGDYCKMDCTFCSKNPEYGYDEGEDEDDSEPV